MGLGGFDRITADRGDSALLSLALYAFALLALFVGTHVEWLGWLSPVSLGGLFVGVTLLWRSSGHRLSELGFTAGQGWKGKMISGLSIGISLPVSLFAVAILLGWLVATPSHRSAGTLAFLLVLGAWKILALVGLEESVFRGYYLQSLLGMSRVWAAVVLSSALWALMHVPSMAASDLPALAIGMGVATWTVTGVALGIGFLRTDRSLLFPLSLHMGYNWSYSTLGTFFFTTPHVSGLWLGCAGAVPESGLLGLLWALAMLCLVRLVTTENGVAALHDGRETLD